MEKPTQLNTPISTNLTWEGMVKVTDPRHPFYQQTFRLLCLTNKQYLGKCCAVLDADDNEILLPLGVTDRSIEPLQIAPLPLDLTSLQQLVLVYTRITAHFREEGIADENFKHNEFPEPLFPSRATGNSKAGSASNEFRELPTHPSGTGLATSFPTPTAGSPPDSSETVSPAIAQTISPGEGR